MQRVSVRAQHSSRPHNTQGREATAAASSAEAAAASSAEAAAGTVKMQPPPATTAGSSGSGKVALGTKSLKSKFGET
jgi:hypothetical protein